MTEHDWQKRQKEHYNQVAEAYLAHYGDVWSQKYRDAFIHRPMFDGIELSGLRVVDAMCGGGDLSTYLHEAGANIVGVDISEKMIEGYQQKWPEAETHCCSILQSGLPENSYDVVAIVGGLHHLHPNADDAIEEVHRILKPGGHFCFMEPHGGSLPDVFRKMWYKRDSLFEANEEAIDITALRQKFSEQFVVNRENYVGNVAYLMVLNSLVFRTPLWIKRLYSPMLLFLEKLIQPLQGRLLSCIVVGQWQKK